MKRKDIEIKIQKMFLDNIKDSLDINSIHEEIEGLPLFRQMTEKEEECSIAEHSYWNECSEAERSFLASDAVAEHIWSNYAENETALVTLCVQKFLAQYLNGVELISCSSSSYLEVDGKKIRISDHVPSQKWSDIHGSPDICIDIRADWSSQIEKLF